MKKVTLLGVLLLVYACKQDKAVEPMLIKTGKLQLVFEPYIDTIPLELYTKQYLSPANDTFLIEQFKFFVHFRSLSAVGLNFIKKENYNLISYTSEFIKKAFIIDSIEVGNYSNLSFDIGVDSVNNHSTVHLGELAPGSGMTWDWNTGYKFLLLEGEYVTPTKNGALVFHVGEDKNYKSLSFNLSSNLKIEAGKTSIIKVKVNINGMFRSPYLIDFDEVDQAMQNSDADKIGSNYAAGMFSISKIVNP